jgi:hypothetical protein
MPYGQCQRQTHVNLWAVPAIWVTVDAVKDKEKYDSMSAALTAELKASMAREGFSRRKMAQILDVDYATFLRYFDKSPRPIPMPIFYGIIDQLQIDEATVFTRAREAFSRR